MTTAARVLTLTDDSFDGAVGAAGVPVLVDVWAAWCPPCHLLSPVVEAVAAELAGRLLVAKVDADANPGIVRRYATMSLPTLLLLVDGVEVARLVGARPKGRLLAELAQLLPAA